MEQSCREPEKARQKVKLRAGNVEAQRGRGEEGSSFYYIRKKKTKRQRHTIKEKRRDDERRWVCVRLGFECVEEEEWNRLKRKRKGGATGDLMLRNPKNPKSESVWVKFFTSHGRVRWRTHSHWFGFWILWANSKETSAESEWQNQIITLLYLDSDITTH